MDVNLPHITPKKAAVEKAGSHIPPFIDLSKAKDVIPPTAPVTSR